MGSAPSLLVDEVHVARQWLRHRFMLFGRTQHELGMRHSKRVKDRASHELKEALAGRDFDHAAEHIGGIAITPERTGVPRQRNFANTLCEIGVIELPVEQMTFRIEL